MDDKTAKELLEKVKTDYRLISANFAKTREKPWEEFDFFKNHMLSNDKIADIGCGSGRLLLSLDKKTDYIGMDNNDYLLAEAEKRFPTSKFIEGDILKIPMENDSKNIVFCIAVLHHIPSKKLRVEALKEIRRILIKKGLVFITVWHLFNKEYAKQIFKSIFAKKLDYKDIFVKWSEPKADRYIHAYTKSELTKDLKKAGFGILKIEYTAHGQKSDFFKGKNICAIARKI